MTEVVASPVASPAPAAPEWFSSMPEQFRNGAAAKGWDFNKPETMGSVVESYFNLEKFVGADKAGRAVVLPGDDDKEGWSKVHAKLGRPDQPNGYELPVPEGADKAFSEQAAAWFHEAGVSKKQAQHLAAKWNEHMGQAAQAQAQAEETALLQEHQALAKDWGTGDAASVNREMARRAAVKLGLDEGAIDALQKVSGFSKTMKALAQIGQMLGERPAAGLGEQSGGFALTPEAARGKKAALMADKEFREKAMASPDSAQWKEIQRLNEIIVASEGQA